MATESAASGTGELIVRANIFGTAAFVLTALIAAISFSTVAQWVGAITAMALFSVGVVAFLWAFYVGVQRSRSEQVSVTQLFLLLGEVAPSRVRRIMLSLLVAQFAVALATTLARPNGPNGSPGSSLAVGFLVPMFGFGLNGLWASYHGRFEPRDDPEALAASVPSDTSGGVGRTDTGLIGKNGPHG
ncbi:MAG: hypothetical protein QNM02_13985 [Acidimicrobiia bacterium]|nr:hypothetical protein [Acidimicrobiia bacterium]